MNRIILIGNGFDLAHGVPTRYEDLIKWYWNKWVERLNHSGHIREDDGLCTFTLNTRNFGWNAFMSNFPYDYNGEHLRSWLKKYPVASVRLSTLLERIVKSIQEKNWVDIEREYYELLKETIGDLSYSKSINEELRLLQNYLTEYMNSLGNQVTANDAIWNLIYEPIREGDIAVTSNSQYTFYQNSVLKMTEDEWQHYRHGYRLYSSLPSERELFPKYVLLLSFNYTSLAQLYNNPQVSSLIQIHGALNEPDKMIFGYGDDLDEDYKKLVKSQDNELLRNIKSVRYLETNDYRKMLQFIESDSYQIYIMGHSCGNSDRTLLNTLFEHENCVSIKPFYHVKADGSDNYLDIVQNISRNFTDKQLMRDRVVNKTLCELLPQSRNV